MAINTDFRITNNYLSSIANPNCTLKSLSAKVSLVVFPIIALITLLADLIRSLCSSAPRAPDPLPYDHYPHLSDGEKARNIEALRLHPATADEISALMDAHMSGLQCDPHFMAEFRRAHQGNPSFDSVPPMYGDQ